MRFSANSSFLIPAVAFLVVRLVTPPLFAAPASDTPGPKLRADALRLVHSLERGAARGCPESIPVVIEQSAPMPASPFWRERLQMDRCGTLVTWDVRYTPSARGATDVSVALEGDGEELPAEPGARRRAPEGKRSFVVTSASSYGPGSLAQAILAANAAPNEAGPDVIRFDIPGTGPHAIALVTPLPAITDPVVIDGTSQAGVAIGSIDEGPAGAAPVEIDGSHLDRGQHGLVLRAGDCTILGLRVRGFDGDAIRIEGGRSNQIEGNVIDGNLLSGVRVTGEGADGNTIAGNRITANVEAGIRLGDGDPADDAGASSKPNDGRRPPVLTSASFDPGRDGGLPDASIDGVLESEPFTAHRVELFANAPTEPSTPQGARFLAATEVVTGADGRVAFQFHMPVGVHGRELLTATATDARGNTSEFSPPLLSPNVLISWNTGTGNWGTAGNWSPAQLPASGDDVVIAANGVNTTFTVTLNVAGSINSLTLGGGSGTQTLSVAGQTLTFAAASTVNGAGTLSFSAGTITGTANLAVNGTFNWSGGTMSGAGTTTVNGPLSLSGLTAIRTNRTLTTTAATTWASAVGLGIQTGTGSVINNSGTWDIQTDGAAIVNAFGGTTTFNNSGTFKKTTTAGSTSINVPFVNTGTLDVLSGTISLGSSGANTNAMTISGAAAVLLFAAGTYDLNAGTVITGPGTLRINTSGTVNVNSAVAIPAATSLGFLAGTLGGTATLTVNGPFTWSGGTMSGAGTTIVNGALALSGLTAVRTNRTLNTTGTITWSSAAGLGVQTGTGSIINNSGTWDAQTDGASIVNAFGGSTTFNNSGTFKKSAGAGSSTIGIPLVNTGTVNAQSGTLVSSGGGSNTNALTISGAAAKILFSAGTFNLNAGTAITGPGTLSLNSSGTLNGNVPVSIPVGTTFEFIAGTFGGTGALTIDGTFNWSGGLMTGAAATTVNGPFNLSGLTAINAGRTLNNASTANWTSGAGEGMWTGGGSIINSTGTWDAQVDGGAIVNHYGGATTFNNSGTYKKSAGSGISYMDIAFTNTATVNVQAGTIAMRAGLTNAATLNVSGAATKLLLNAGTDDFNAGSVVTGPGTIELNSSGTMNVNTPLAMPAATTFSFLAGTLSGTSAFTVNGTFNWTGGSMSGAAATTANGPLNVSGLVRVFNSRTLNTNALTTWTASGGLGIQTGTGSIINNAGTWDVQTDANAIVNTFGGATTFNNSGTFRKSAGPGNTNVSIPFFNTGTVDVQSGTLNVSSSSYNQTAGTTRVTAALSSTTTIAIQGGVLMGTGTVTGPVVVSGTGAVAPGLSPGILTIAGNYTQSGPNGAFNVELGGTTAGTQYDRLNVTGAPTVATLGGVLNVSLVSGFTPVAGNTFTIMNYVSRTGTFATLNLPSLGCLGWKINYGPTSVVLSVVAVPAEIEDVLFAANKTTLSWSTGPIGPAATYDVLRGALSTLPVGPGAGETCFGQGLLTPTATDASDPAPGTGVWYVVRERRASCGVGTYGYATSGAERISTGCP